MAENRRQSVNILGPVLLIAAGVILLLNTLGILEWSVWWTILRLWPVLLIAAGLDILIGRRSVWGSLLAALLVLGVLAGALWLSLGGGDLPGGGRGLEAETIRQPLEGADSAQVTLEPAVGRLEIEALAESADLVQGTVYRNNDEELQHQVSESGGRITFSLASGEVAWAPFVSTRFDQRLWELGLSPGAALDLKASLGAGEMVLDLTGLQIESLEADLGLGRIEVILPAEGRFEADVEGALGDTVIVIPAGLAARVEVDGGLTGRRLPDGYEQEGNVYTSPDYDSAENRVELRVSQAMGALTVREAR